MNSLVDEHKRKKTGVGGDAEDNSIILETGEQSKDMLLKISLTVCQYTFQSS
jgi:hypothetical protein